MAVRLTVSNIDRGQKSQWRRNRGFRRFNEPGPRAPGAPE